ncbi:MAG: ATP-binding protein [Bdellovibrionales bacterium]|nr:ATP-binding protein [Bdellovibrionales bacterium]
MQVRRNVIWATIALMLFFTVLLTSRYLTLMRQEQNNQLSMQSEQQVKMLRELVRISTENLKDKIVNFIGQEQTLRHQGLNEAQEESLKKQIQSSPYWGMGLLRINKGLWEPQWVRQKSSWPEGFAKALIQSVITKGEIVGGEVWIRLEDPKSQPLFAYVFEVKDGNETLLAFALTSTTDLNFINEIYFQSGSNEVALINDKGYALAFNEMSYVGFNLLPSHPVYAKILQNNESFALLDSTQTSSASKITATAKIPGTNLFAVVSVPQQKLFISGLQLKFYSLFIILALLGFLLAMISWLFLPIEEAIQYLSQQLTRVASGLPALAHPKRNPILQPLAKTIMKLTAHEGVETPDYIKKATEKQVENEKILAYQKMSLGFSQTLRDPIAAILAQTQLAHSHEYYDKFKEQFITIENEARRARGTIDQLIQLTGAEEFPKTQVDVSQLVEQTLEELKTLLQIKKIHVQKNLIPGQSIKAHPEPFRVALEEIIKNAIDAMETAEHKILKIYSIDVEGEVKIIIEDHGVGMEDHQIQKATDPFFTTKNQDQHKGLGLTIAKGILSSMKGRLNFIPQKEGLKVEIDFTHPQRLVENQAVPAISSLFSQFAFASRTEVQLEETKENAFSNKSTGTPLKEENQSPEKLSLFRRPKVKESGL